VKQKLAHVLVAPVHKSQDVSDLHKRRSTVRRDSSDGEDFGRDAGRKVDSIGLLIAEARRCGAKACACFLDFDARTAARSRTAPEKINRQKRS
jgi:hypothetical protein